jgi:tRNA-specific 2-thiouridylase
MFATIGQRQGLKIGGKKGKAEAPWYVAQKNVSQNSLIVVQGSNHPALFHSTLIASQLHWINEPPLSDQPLYAKIRYRQTDQACKIIPLNQTQYSVHFDVPQRAITPGQAIVFYQDEVCLGGGMIEQSM